MKWNIDRRRLLTSLAATAALPASLPLISDGAQSEAGVYRLPSHGGEERESRLFGFRKFFGFGTAAH
jgi:hypothetical protein